MPQYPGGDCSPWLPRRAYLVELIRRWSTSQPLHLLRRDCQSEISRRPDVRPAQHHQQINIRRPASDTFDFDKLGFYSSVIHRTQRVEIKQAFENRASEFASVYTFLAAEPDCFQCRVIQFEK